MCTNADKRVTARLRKRAERNGGKIVAWKVYRVCNGTLRSPHYSRSLNGVIGRPGVIESDRASGVGVLWGKGGYADIYCGIHAYRKKADALRERSSREVLVRVVADVKDLLGADILKYGGAIVFQRVRIYAKDFHRAVQKGS